ncbi:hypothetical protein PUNSTDRAFT_107489 [Punctularia strigosozonata HHB-11173 SS5]|uniref:SGNH hydrolase-type esterase domain-containing protein n=1 Tax=Punctularia strigosozonata (strain HHB-11173) TaxID=741275 RepID=R7S4N1_PUNST|nr:uncharacterized protein PUNSTDRAFT_107489 [Punctularia strigosozonata HHB-11173 SS5]EIN05193.1 hypothetical protein PUNSTDRAFT_107489 [Punctularia strigosozonata HHB-11173 SS5]
MRLCVIWTLLAIISTAHGSPLIDATKDQTVTISNTHPLIFYHGRWDSSPGTWWADSGLKLNVQDLSALTLNLGSHTTSPLASVGVSVDNSPFYQVNVSEGANVIPLSAPSSPDFEGEKSGSTLVRINVEGWQNNRINLESITLNKGAKLLPYERSKLAFQFIGDSLSAGQYLPHGVNQAWPFLTGEFFGAEHNINAQPGATLSDIPSYGNVHGVSFEFFRTEDTGYYYTTDHNYTTPWNFARDVPPTHVVVHIGANDASQNVTDTGFFQVYDNFLTRLRTLYPTQPVFVFTPWGWPQPDGPNSYYYETVYPEIVKARHDIGDRNVFLVNTTGWVTYEDVFPGNIHPSVAGHIKIAGLFEKWLENWGLKQV